MKLFDELKWRGLIKDITSPELEEKLNKGGMTFYIGTDPTADSMHIGHLSSFLISKRLKDAGHNPILLIGGATGMIGDPKATSERALISKEKVQKNFEGLKKQAEKIFGFEVVNNYDWCKDINMLDFLRDYGKHFNINYMLDKDIIRRRLETGITYTEFSYMLIQALDFMHLHIAKGVDLQVAGSDQWGNITAGVDLIRKACGDEVYAFTMPLITDSRGVKFGKTEGNALWLDKEKTSPYEMYQFLVNSEDAMVIDYLKVFTFLSKEEIEAIEKEHLLAPEKRLAHKTLAYEVVKFLHGEEEAEKAKKISEEVFKTGLSADMPTKEITTAELGLLDLLVNLELVPSKSEARRLVVQGGISINKEKIMDPSVEVKDLLKEDSCILQKGKKTFIKIVLKK